MKDRGKENLGLNNCRQQGVALFLTVILSLIGLILVGGLFIAYQRMLGMVFPIKTYATLREAASGTVELIASYVDKDYFEKMGRGECPPSLTKVDNFCCQGIIRFHLIGEPGDFVANSTVCIVGIVQAGYGISPVVELDPGLKGSQPYLYSIIVRATGPRGTLAIVESLYASK